MFKMLTLHLYEIYNAIIADEGMLLNIRGERKFAPLSWYEKRPPSVRRGRVSGKTFGKEGLYRLLV